MEQHNRSSRSNYWRRQALSCLIWTVIVLFPSTSRNINKVYWNTSGRKLLPVWYKSLLGLMREFEFIPPSREDPPSPHARTNNQVATRTNSIILAVTPAKVAFALLNIIICHDISDSAIPVFSSLNGCSQVGLLNSCKSYK